MPSAPYWTSEKAFLKAVEAATKEATQEVAARNRRRLRVESLLIGIVVASAIAIPTTKIISASNAKDNCELITTLATVGQEESEEATQSTKDFEAKSKDRLGLSQRDFSKLAQEGKERRERHLRAIKSVAEHSCG